MVCCHSGLQCPVQVLTALQHKEASPNQTRRFHCSSGGASPLAELGSALTQQQGRTLSVPPELLLLGWAVSATPVIVGLVSL